MFQTTQRQHLTQFFNKDVCKVFYNQFFRQICFYQTGNMAITSLV